jgi:tetratricopeptide (TPR) repeat protein
LSKFAYPSPKAFLLILALTAFVLLAYFLRSANSSAPPKTEALKLFNNGTEAMRDGTYYKASKMFEDAIKIDGSFALAHARLAEAWMELDYMGRSQNEMLKVRNLQQENQHRFSFAFSNTDDESLYIDATNATLLRDFSKAAKIYETLLNRYPNEPYAYLDLGRAYEKNEEADKAIEYYEKTAGLNAQYGAAFLRLGILRNRKAEFEKSNDAFNTAEITYERLSNDEGIAEVKFQRGVSHK